LHCLYKLIALITNVTNIKVNIAINQYSVRDDVSAVRKVSLIYLMI
jgi:hypothetical protein